MTRVRHLAPRTALPGYLRLDQDRSLGLPAPMWRVLVLILFLAGVEVYARFILATPFELVPVTTMATRAGELITEPAFLRDDLAWTALTIGVSFVAAAVLGVVTAYAMHRFRWCDLALQPYVSVFYAVPTFAMYPLLVVLLGTGLAPIIVISTSFSAVVVIARARDGFSSVSASVVKVSGSLRLTRFQHFRLILVPSALPDIISGLKLALSYAVISVLATEFILSTRGAGHFISRAYTGFNSTDMYGGILLVSLLALVLILVVNRLGSAIDWRQR
ncbi:ABC transporter permease [Nocardiopsis aegyptia]|uniref:NitT/TauT family transport system permease protein n=1 Tax=Nocardiopsis aegyptia TaxID=220378 RepID=A0A7Z0EMU9_9ACTN|nr:ABC transporter permease subunit [Nocardiopsis aegyptia]NYJ35015.1 NitT/TauT family transport system permease protein [Nocardiopsis aegyptia]